MKLTLAYSPCPNDTYIFGAIALGLIKEQDLEFEIHLNDIQALNKFACQSTFDITKVSYAAIVKNNLLDSYTLLSVGAALGYNCGPLIISNCPLDPSELTFKRIVTPGEFTTAHLLLQLFAPQVKIAGVLPFDQIMLSVAKGEFDVGVIIHESRFTFPEYGLHLVADLGVWWQKQTSMPLPLGGFIAKKTLGIKHISQVEACIIKSLNFAENNSSLIMNYVNQHAQEIEEQIQLQHIELYVNKFTKELGKIGLDAIQELFTQTKLITS